MVCMIAPALCHQTHYPQIWSFTLILTFSILCLSLPMSVQEARERWDTKGKLWVWYTPGTKEVQERCEKCFCVKIHLYTHIQRLAEIQNFRKERYLSHRYQWYKEHSSSFKLTRIPELILTFAVKQNLHWRYSKRYTSLPSTLISHAFNFLLIK